MSVSVVVATKGRAQEVSGLVKAMSLQSTKPALVVVACNSISRDTSDGLLSLCDGFQLEIISVDPPGLTKQRNAAIAMLKNSNLLINDDDIVVFFDDDFRPAPDWLEKAVKIFKHNDRVVGVTGLVLADGVKGAAISEERAESYLSGKIEPVSHWASGSDVREVDSVYGCNMAWRRRVICNEDFDEVLALYGWQEDRDYTGRAANYGLVIYNPACRGVHLGVKGARTSGKQLGYSQVVNPIYLYLKGTIKRRAMLHLLIRAFVSNAIKSLKLKSTVDFRGRLRGNLLAIRHVLSGTVDPRWVLNIK